MALTTREREICKQNIERTSDGLFCCNDCPIRDCERKPFVEERNYRIIINKQNIERKKRLLRRLLSEVIVLQIKRILKFWRDDMPKLVSWSEGMDEEITNMINAYRNGEISLDDIKSVWETGDVRQSNGMKFTLGRFAEDSEKYDRLQTFIKLE